MKDGRNKASPRRKLTPTDVRRIRSWYQRWLTTPSLRGMAKQEGVAVGTLLDCARGYTYKEIKQ